VRWTSPVIQFTRKATEDTEIAGHKIREGDEVALFYPSANRDDSVFAAPNKFDIGRYPNQHIAFGIGEHFCLGANLARLEPPEGLALPAAPIRAVRPIRWTYASGSSGISKLMMWLMSATSIPRLARSVATSTSNLLCRNPFIPRSRLL